VDSVVLEETAVGSASGVGFVNSKGLELILPEEPGRRDGGMSGSRFRVDRLDRSLPLEGGALPTPPSCLLEGLEILPSLSVKKVLCPKLPDGPWFEEETE